MIFEGILQNSWTNWGTRLTFFISNPAHYGSNKDFFSYFTSDSKTCVWFNAHWSSFKEHKTKNAKLHLNSFNEFIIEGLELHCKYVQPIYSHWLC